MNLERLPDMENPAQYVRVSDLLLDVGNPRRTSRDVQKNQEELLKEMYQRFDLDDLIASLAAYGYFSEEPLIGIPEQEGLVDEPPFVVVEGNRRLAALKILLSSRDRNLVNVKRLPDIAEVARSRLDPVPVKVYPIRSEVLPYLGVRHIVGVKQWESLAKARYCKALIDAGYSFPEVAGQVGSGKRTDVVRRWLLTLYSIEQANTQSEVPWDEVDERFGFSWLYTALGYLAVRDYLGIKPEVFSEPVVDPVPKERLSNLLEHMEDLYGPAPGDSRQAAVRESRQIGDLAKIYGNEDAIAALRAGASLQVALRKTVNEETQLVDLLLEAKMDLELAGNIAPNHAGHQEATKHARQCSETASHVVASLERV